MASFCVKIYKNKEDRWQMWPKLTEKSELKSANTKLSFVVGLTNELTVGLNTDSKNKKKRFDRKLASLDLRYCTFSFKGAKKIYQVV